MDGAYKALEQLRNEGLVKAIGVGVKEWEVCHQALLKGDFDCFLLAGRYTLLAQESLNEFLPLCQKRDVAVIVGGGFNSGILATGAKEGAKYNYAPAPVHIMEKVSKIEGICADLSRHKRLKQVFSSKLTSIFSADREVKKLMNEEMGNINFKPEYAIQSL